MSAAVLLFVKRNWVFIAVGLAIVVIQGWYGYLLYSRGVADTENKQQRSTVDQLEERNATNETVRSISDARKCKLIGGVYHHGRCE